MNHGNDQNTGWSPFEPNDPDGASLPVAGLEYRFTNDSSSPVEAVFSWNARHFMAVGNNHRWVLATPGGFVLKGGPGKDRPNEAGAFSATVDDPAVKVNCAWFRGAWFDPLTMIWRDIAAGECPERPPVTEGGASPGGSLFVPFTLGPRESKTIVLRFAWYVGESAVRTGKEPEGGLRPHRAPIGRGTSASLTASTPSRPIGASTTTTCARRHSGSATASTTRRCPTRSSRRWRRTSRS